MISACLLTDGDVQIVSVIEDEDYWDMVENDPAD